MRDRLLSLSEAMERIARVAGDDDASLSLGKLGRRYFGLFSARKRLRRHWGLDNA